MAMTARRFWARLRDAGGFAWYAAVRFEGDRCFQAAAALTYTSLLALVPLLTITLGILSAFPAFDQVRVSAQEMIFENFVPQVGAEVAQYLERFSANAGQLTAFGVIGLIVTAVLLLATVEGAFNDIWRVRESRPWLVRILSFWAILTLTPLLFAASLSVSNQLFAQADLSGRVPLWTYIVGLLPWFLEIVGFTFLYNVIPNRPVRLQDCFVGGIVAAVLFELAKFGFALYLTAFPVYTTLYGALSTIPIFLVWLYLVFSILLLGAVVASALPEWRAGKLLGAHWHDLLPARRATIALAVLGELLEASRRGHTVRRKTLLGQIPIGAATLDSTLDQLRRARFVERGSTDNWLLSRDLSTATVYDLLKSLNIGLRGLPAALDGLPSHWQARLTDLLRRADESQAAILGVRLSELLAPEPSKVTPLRLPDGTSQL